MKKSTLPSSYGQTRALNQPVQAECWNFTSGEIFTLPAGTLLNIEHVYDATHTTCMLVDAEGNTPGVTLGCQDGVSRTGYRFIVLNTDLSSATGLQIPARTYDLVGEMVQYESIGLPRTRARRLLRKLKTSRTLRGLQGSYGRAAERAGI